MPFPQLGAVGAFRSDDDLADQCLVYAVGGLEDFTNLVNGTPPQRGGTGAGLASLNRDHGPAFSTNGSANGFVTFGTAADFTVGTGDFAFAMLVDQGSLVNAFSLFISGGLELLYPGIAGRRAVRINGGGIGSEATGLNDGKAHLAVFSRSNGVGSYWVDGALISSSSATTSVTATSGLTIGKRGSAGTYYAVPATAMVGYWSRALSNDEAQRLADDPFLLSRPRTALLRGAPSIISTPVGRADETDTAFALAPKQIMATGRADETDTAYALSQPSGVGRANETDTAYALAAKQVRATGLATETDTAAALGRAVGITRASEADTAFALAPLAIRAVGRADEADSAFARTAVQIAPVGRANETDVALMLTSGQSATVGLAIETDTATALSALLVRGAGRADEADTAFALAGVQQRAAGLASEADAAFARAPVSIRPATAANENDAAFNLSPVQIGATGNAAEIDTAFALFPADYVVPPVPPGRRANTSSGPRRASSNNGNRRAITTTGRRAA